MLITAKHLSGNGHVNLRRSIATISIFKKRMTVPIYWAKIIVLREIMG